VGHNRGQPQFGIGRRHHAALKEVQDIDVDKLPERFDRHKKHREGKNAGVHHADGGVFFESGKSGHESDHADGNDTGNDGSQKQGSQTDFFSGSDGHVHQQITGDDSSQHRVRNRIGKKRHSPQDDKAPQHAAGDRHQGASDQWLEQDGVLGDKILQEIHGRSERTMQSLFCAF